MKKLSHEGKTIYYQIIRKAIKHTYFRVKDGYIKITANRHMSEDQMIDYMLSKFNLFYQKTESSKKTNSDDTCHLWGKPYQMIVSTGRFQYQIKDQTILVSRPLSKECTFKKDIYHKEMLKMLPDILNQILNHIKDENILPCPIKLKYLKSKFGSYHRKKHEITLNTFLATLDPMYLSYVIYHEYAHALVFNHSKAFYNVLDRWLINHKRIQKDLKKIAII